MIHGVLRPQYLDINHKRAHRICTAEGLAMSKYKRTLCIGVPLPPVAAMAVNQALSMAFVSDATAGLGAVS